MTGTIAHDHEGRRVSETTAASTKRYLIDGLLPYGQVVAETDSAGALVAAYVYGLDRIAQDRAGVTRTFAADGQGSVRQLTDAAGAVTDEYWYTAFGDELAKVGTTENGFRYTGEQWDPGTGWYYLRARWMNPNAGRFVSVDPQVGDRLVPLSLHRYGYANFTPASLSDPTGESVLALYFLPVMLLGVLSCDVLPKLFAEFPPSVEDMLKAREVIAGFDDAIVASNMADPIYGHEECGWIYASPKKPYMVPLRQKRKDTKMYECSLSNPYLMPDMWVVATYHIHPHGPPLADLSQIWSPSADDLNGIASQGVPGFVLSAYQEKLYTPYGLYRRPKYDKDKHLWP